jgi:TolB-like protein/Tfp pilus assembly protein PilF
MKLCAKCGRKYPDETLNYCLDDGSELVYGPTVEDQTLIKGTAGNQSDPQTAILSDAFLSRENEPPSTSATANSKIRNPFYIAAAAIVLLLTIGLAAKYGFRSAATTNETANIHSIAVLPLDNLSGDSSQEYFSDGMTDALISDLAQIKSLKVISRTSVMRFKGSQKALPEIARELGVDAIVEGSVTRAGGRVRVSAQLVPASTDAAVWSRNYEREMSDLLRLQSDIAQAIAGEIKAQLTASEQQRLSGVKTIDPNASEEYLLGKYQLQKHTDTNLELAIGHFTRAIEVEPNYAEAWAGLSNAWFQRGIWGKYSHSDVESAARNAAQKALDLDPNLSDAQIAMVYLDMNYDFDWPSAEEHSKRAIELDPSNSAAYIAYGWYLINFSRFDELRQAMSTAEQLDPVSPNLQSDFGRMLYRARVYSEAETHLRSAIELDENDPGAYSRLADVFRETQRFDEAISCLDKALEKGGGDASIVRKAIVYARMGQKQKALELWNSVEKKSSVDQARFSTEFEDLDTTFQALNRALDQHETVLPHMRVDPDFDKLHSDPRWAKFLARMNLPPS